MIGWPDLLNRILAATTSGQGPDVVNIGNTWSASLQATGALLPWTSQDFASIGGESQVRVLGTGLDRSGRQAAGRRPAVLGRLRAVLQQGAVPAGRHHRPARHLGRADRRRQEADPRRQSMAWPSRAAAPRRTSTTRSSSPSSTAATSSRRRASPDVYAARMRAGVQQFVNLMGADKIASPGDAEYDQNQSVSDFATGKAAMLMWQAAGANLQAHGMSTEPVRRRSCAGPVRRSRAGHQRRLDGGRHQHRHLQEHARTSRRRRSSSSS